MGRNCKFWSECHSVSEVRIRNSGLCLCRRHFMKSFEDRMERSVSHYHMETSPFGVQEQWALYCDGSDHSLALIAALSRRFRPSTPRLKITAVHVNVGLTVQDYSKTVEDYVRAFCEKCSMPVVVVNMKEELGVSADDVHAAAAAGKLENSAANAVNMLSDGLFRNTAHKMGAHKIAMCDSLNDTAGDLLSRWCSMDIERIAQRQPWSEQVTDAPENGWTLPRVCPFVEISDDELNYYFGKCLDFVPSLSVPSFKVPYYKSEFEPPLLQQLLSIEKERAGTLLRMVRGFDQSILSIVRPEFLTQMREGTLKTAAADPTLDIIRENHAKKDTAPDATTLDRKDEEEMKSTILDRTKTHPCSKCGMSIVLDETLCPCCRIAAAVVAAEKKPDVSFELQPRKVPEPGTTLSLLKTDPTAPGEGLRARKRNAWKRRQEEAAAKGEGKNQDGETVKEPDTKKPK